MSTVTMKPLNPLATVHELGPQFAARAAEADAHDRFVAENYTALKERQFFSALIPAELGGGGATYAEMCAALRSLAGYCGSTALAVSMHQHLVAANVWKYKAKNEAGPMLQKVAAEQLVLVSTGARDWLESNGSIEKVDGGFAYSGAKAFASGCPAGDLLMTSGPYEDPQHGWQVLHFPIPLAARGVRIGNDWQMMGMRGTGSNTVTLEHVFVPETAVSLRRPRGKFHPFYGVVLTVAMPLVTSVYVGLADRAAQIAVAEARKRPQSPILALQLGELENERAAAEIALNSMIALTNEYVFTPDAQQASNVLVRKTLATHAAVRTVNKAFEIVGARGMHRSHELERILRDIQAGEFHPLPEKRQQEFTGRVALGLEPVE